VVKIGVDLNTISIDEEVYWKLLHRYGHLVEICFNLRLWRWKNPLREIRIIVVRLKNIQSGVRDGYG